MDNKESVDELAKKIYEYHHLHHQLIRSDVILCWTSNDLRVAEYAAKLYHDGWAPLIVFSGNRPFAGDADIRVAHWGVPESEKFREVALARGVPDDKILVEAKSLNSGENARFCYELLKERGMLPKSVIILQKPYMERRAWAIFRKQWPDPTKNAIVTSPPIAYEDYPTPDIPKDTFIKIMVEDMRKIIEYPAQGFQIEQEVPEDIRMAYDELVRLGYGNSSV